MNSEVSWPAFRQILASLRNHVEYLRESGIEGIPNPPKPEGNPSRLGKKQRPQEASSSSVPPAGSLPESRLAQSGDLFLSPGVLQAQTLEELRAEIGDCRRCRLCQSRTQIVFGVGNPKADLVFVGEAPGRDEDLKGEPFVGRAGQLLTEIITKGMGLSRTEVYIANVVKCRPPENRNPEPDEVAACEPFLIRQLELVWPKVIVALGTFAVQTLLKTRTPITRLRGVWHQYHGIKVMPTFHPAYLLRNPQDKRLVWKDIQEVMRELGLKPKGRSPQPPGKV